MKPLNQNSQKNIKQKKDQNQSKNSTIQQQQQQQAQQNNQYSNTIDYQQIPPSTHYSQKSNTNTNVSYADIEAGGESVKVALRVRPMNQMEISRGDEYCVKTLNQNTVQIFHKGINKQFKFNYVLNEKTSQSECFQNLNVGEMLEAALDGYSATIFAYGQTGSGKTYTMAGNEQNLGREVYRSDESEGIIPRAIRYLWQAMAQRQEQFYVKASFTEIYNEQLYDLLNPSSNILHCRWNAKNGFFVEDLMIVECTRVDDMVAVLNEGMKNRRQGEHELNDRSSRSHSILTAYLISEFNSGDQIIKKYGKLSFVDLAGSERLKETKSQGEMVKETGNINKSLFTLGKVIKSLTDKKTKQPYIPYRDSKLTMLLMDSLGGTAKALMISCVGPGACYFEETLSTMNYASRTMNIKNKPVVQMDQKDQIIFNLQREVELLRMENKYLRDQLQRVSNGLPIEVQYTPSKKRKSLPPIKSGQSSNKTIDETDMIDVSMKNIVDEYQFEINKLRSENDELRNAREVSEKSYHLVMNENNALQIKLENLERVFIGNNQKKGDMSKDSMAKEYMSSALMMENAELKKKIKQIEEKNFELSHSIKNSINENVKEGSDPQDINDLMKMQHQNRQLQQRVEFLQNRERDLMNNMLKLQKANKNQ